jgi:hypothetical protein
MRNWEPRAVESGADFETSPLHQRSLPNPEASKLPLQCAATCIYFNGRCVSLNDRSGAVATQCREELRTGTEFGWLTMPSIAMHRALIFVSALKHAGLPRLTTLAAAVYGYICRKPGCVVAGVVLVCVFSIGVPLRVETEPVLSLDVTHPFVAQMYVFVS